MEKTTGFFFEKRISKNYENDFCPETFVQCWLSGTELEAIGKGQKFFSLLI